MWNVIYLYIFLRWMHMIFLISSKEFVSHPRTSGWEIIPRKKVWWALLRLSIECPSSSVFLRTDPAGLCRKQNIIQLKSIAHSLGRNESVRQWDTSGCELRISGNLLFLSHILTLFFLLPSFALPDPQTQGKDAPITLQSWGDKEDKSFHPKDRGAQVWENLSLKASQSHLSVPYCPPYV